MVGRVERLGSSASAPLAPRKSFPAPRIDNRLWAKSRSVRKCSLTLRALQNPGSNHHSDTGPTGTGPTAVRDGEAVSVTEVEFVIILRHSQADQQKYTHRCKRETKMTSQMAHSKPAPFLGFAAGMRYLRTVVYRGFCLRVASFSLYCGRAIHA